jgi:hypothetical protein
MAAAAMIPFCVETACNPLSFPGVSFTALLLDKTVILTESAGI